MKQEILKDFKKESTKCRDNWMEALATNKERTFYNIGTIHTTIPKYRH